MAAYAASGTLTANAVTTLSFTRNANYVVVNVGSTPTGTVNVTTDGSTPTVGGNDTFLVSSGTTAVVRNMTPRQDNITATIPNPTDPSAAPTQATQSSTVKLISAAACTYFVTLTNYPGAATVLG